MTSHCSPVQECIGYCEVYYLELSQPSAGCVYVFGGETYSYFKLKPKHLEGSVGHANVSLPFIPYQPQLFQGKLFFNVDADLPRCSLLHMPLRRHFNRCRWDMAWVSSR